MGNGARECEWRHSPEARWGFWEIWKCQLVELSAASEEDVWLSLARRSQASGLVAGATSFFLGGGRWKSQNRKNVYLSPYDEEPLNSKLIKKSFVPELRSHYVFFVFRDSYVLCIYVMNIRCTFHISVYGYDTLVSHHNWIGYRVI